MKSDIWLVLWVAMLVVAAIGCDCNDDDDNEYEANEDKTSDDGSIVPAAPERLRYVQRNSPAGSSERF